MYQFNASKITTDSRSLRMENRCKDSINIRNYQIFLHKNFVIYYVYKKSLPDLRQALSVLLYCKGSAASVRLVICVVACERCSVFSGSVVSVCRIVLRTGRTVAKLPQVIL